MLSNKQLQKLFTSSTKQVNWKNIQKSRSQEVLFVGRSNVGKSSLLNSILSTRDLVGTSRHAGHTKHLGYFSTCNGKLTLVDAPGYGSMGRDVWGDIIEEYIETRINLNRIVVLINAMHGLLDSDLAFLDYLNRQREESAVNWVFQLAFTKSDTVPKDLLTQQLDIIQNDLVKRFPTFTPPIHQLSVKDPSSIMQLRRNLLS